MSKALHISGVHFARGSAQERESGLLGYVSFLLDDRVRLDGVALRRTRKGQLTLSFPARRDRDGRAHPYVHPVDGTTMRAIQAEVVGQLGLEQEEID